MCIEATMILLSSNRDSLSSQLDQKVTKAESEQLAQALQEEQYFELIQENKKALARHKQEVGERESTISKVKKTHHLIKHISTALCWVTL